MSDERDIWAASTAETQELRVHLLDSEREAIQEQYLALKALRYAAAACGLAALAVAATALVGRLSGNWMLASYNEGDKIIVPAVGLSLVLLAVAVIAVALARRTPPTLTRVLGSVVIIIGGLRLAEVALGANWGSSELFLPPPLLPHAPEEIPAALPTAIGLLLAGVFLVQPTWRGAGALRIVAVGGVTVIGGAFLLGYVYGKPLLYGSALVPIALPAALSLTLVGIGMAFIAAAREAAVHRLIAIRTLEEQAERERLAADIEAQRNQLEAIVNHAPAALVFFDGHDLTVKWNNHQYTHLLDEEFVDKDLTGLHLTDFVPTAEEEGVTRPIRQAAAGQVVSLPEFEYLGFERGPSYFQWTAVPVNRSDGAGYDVLIMATEITDQVVARRKIEELAREAQAQRDLVQGIVENLSVGVVLLEADLRVKLHNRVYASFFDLPDAATDLKGRYFSEYSPLAEESGAADLYRRAAAGEIINIPEWEFHGFERGVTYWNWTIVPLPRPDGEGNDALGVMMEVTEQVQARHRVEALTEEAQRRASELDAIINSIADGIAVYDLDGRIIRHNRIFAELTLYSQEVEESILGERMVRLKPRDAAGKVLPAEETPPGRALQGETVTGFAMSFEDMAGTTHVVMASAAPLHDIGGAITGAVMTLTDITPLHQAQEELRRLAEELRASNDTLAATNRKLEDAYQSLAVSEERYRTIGELVPYGIWSTDSEGAITYVSPAILELTGLTFEEYAGFKWADLLPDGEREEFVSAWLAASRAGVYWSHEYRMMGKDGQYHWLIGRGVPQFDADGKLKGYLGVNVDIGELKAAEEVVRTQRGFLQAILDQMPSGVLVIEAGTSRVLLANTVINEIWGREMLGQIMRDFLAPVRAVGPQGELKSADDWPVMRALNRAEIINNEVVRVNRPDGTVHHVAANAAPIRDEAGDIIAAIVTATDVTEAAEAQEELRRHRDHLEDLIRERTAELQKSETKYRELIETAHVAIIRWNRDGIIEFNNEYAERLFGYEAEGLLGKPVTLIGPPVHETGLTPEQSIAALLANPEAFRVLGSDQITKDGRRLWILWSHHFIYDQEGKVQAVLAVGTDRTEQHRAQRELEANQRRLRAAAAELAIAEQRERQRLAAALHDEVAQTLSAIKLNLSMLRSTMAAAPTVEHVTSIGGMVDEAIRQTRAIMSELSPPILTTQGLLEALRWWGEQLKERHGLEVTVTAEGLVERLPSDIESTAFQMAKELLQNIVKHARATQATIIARCDEKRLEVEVGDDGVGFDPAEVETTEKGGFGLFSVRERLAYLGGELRIHSAPGQGTRMTISLPVPCQQDAS
ncbi:MAG: sensor histidine kinase [Armatimonadota bacterium]